MSQGIFGVIDFGKEIETPGLLADNMAGVLRKDRNSREGISCVCNCHYVLGMKRVRYNSSVQQAVAPEDRELAAICLIHGEINNYQDLLEKYIGSEVSCEGDLDLSVHLYRRHGPQFARKLNGLFSMAILDQRDPSLILLNDRFGMAHQVYWTVIGGRLYFATQLRCLLACPEIKPEIDIEGLNLFLKYSYIPSPWTIFRRIRKLPSGHMLIFKNGKTSVNSYWEFTSPDGSRIDLQEAISTYKDLLEKAISRRLESNGGLGILLSGGLDSSGNVALAAESTSQKIKTFSVGFDDPVFDERPYARIISDCFNTEHYETVMTGDEIEDLPKLIWHLEEPYFEFGLFLTYIGMRSAREEVDTVIGGEGADQLFGTGGFAGGRPAAMHYLLLKSGLLGAAAGLSRLTRGSYFYKHDNLAFKFRLFWQRAIDLNDWYFYGYDQHELLKLYKDPSLARIPEIFPLGSDTLSTYSLPPSFSFADLYLQTQINQDLKHYVNENVMVKSARMADMLGLNLRESYLDTGVTDFLTSLDFSMKRSGGLSDHLRGKITTKYLHRKAMEDLLPEEIMKKPKQGGFVPVMIFLKNPDIRKKIYRHLLDSRIMKEYFRHDYMRNLFEGYERMQGRKIYWHNFYNSKANRILFLLTFDIWNYLYMNKNTVQVLPSSLSDYLG